MVVLAFMYALVGAITGKAYLGFVSECADTRRVQARLKLLMPLVVLAWPVAWVLGLTITTAAVVVGVFGVFADHIANIPTLVRDADLPTPAKRRKRLKAQELRLEKEAKVRGSLSTVDAEVGALSRADDDS